MSKQITWYESDSRTLAASITDRLLHFDYDELSSADITTVIAEKIAEYVGPLS